MHANIHARREYYRRYRLKNLKRLRAYGTAWRKAHPDQVRAYARKGYAANPQKTLDKGRRLKYGLSREQFEKRFASQGKKCAVCRSDKPRGRGTWHADHDHARDKFRGVLCSPCNLMLGLAKDKVRTLKNAILYLKGKK